jgi:hypothetical protein
MKCLKIVLLLAITSLIVCQIKHDGQNTDDFRYQANLHDDSNWSQVLFLKDFVELTQREPERAPTGTEYGIRADIKNDYCEGSPLVCKLPYVDVQNKFVISSVSFQHSVQNPRILIGFNADDLEDSFIPIRVKNSDDTQVVLDFQKKLDGKGNVEVIHQVRFPQLEDTRFINISSRIILVQGTPKAEFPTKDLQSCKLVAISGGVYEAEISYMENSLAQTVTRKVKLDEANLKIIQNVFTLMGKESLLSSPKLKKRRRYHRY